MEPRPAVLLLLFAVSVSGCRFDRSGLRPRLRYEDGRTPEAGLDLLQPDMPLDLPVRPDTTPDLVPPFDTGGARPLSTSDLASAFAGALVPCVDKNGQDKRTKIPIMDGSTVAFFDGAKTLPGAPTDTLIWAGAGPLVTVVYNLNACDEELPGRAEWGDAGLLVRKAYLSQGRLVLQPGATVSDINLLDVDSYGAFEAEVAEPDDAKLAVDHPQLVNPVNEAKKLIIELGLP